MHPLNVDWFRLIISSRSMIRYLQRRVSWWLAIWSLNLLFRSQFSCNLNADCFKILISARFFNAEWVSATVENARLFMTGDLVTHSVVSISIIMHPQRWLLHNINLIKVYHSISSSISSTQPRRVSMRNSRESGRGCCLIKFPNVQNINLTKVYDSISSSISSTQSEYEKQSRIGTSLLSQVHPMLVGTSLLSKVHPMFIVVCWVWYRFNILRMLFYPI